VVVAEIAGKRPPQRRLVKDDHMIEALAANCANHAFDVGSLPRRSRRRKYLLYAHLLDFLRKLVAKDSVAISQEVARRGVPRKRVTQLLSRPFPRRVSRDIEMQDAASVVSHTKNTYRTWNRIVGTVKKSTDTMVLR